MKKIGILALILVLWAGQAWAGPPKAPGRIFRQKLHHISPRDTSKQRVIVRFRSEKAMNRLDKRVPSAVKKRYRRFSMMAADLSGKEAAILAQDPGVMYIEPDYVYRLLNPVTQEVPLQEGEVGEEYQYGLGNMSVTDALHQQGYTGKGAKVGVIDSGVASLHPDLDVDGGWNFYNDDIYFGDVNGHGTHVAGIIAAERNGLGVVGVAPGADLYSLRVCDIFGNCPTSAIIDGVQWAIDHDLDVINLSLGGSRRSSAMEEAMDRAYKAGTLIVAAAGNSGRSGDNVSYPAKFDSVIAVSAVDEDNRIATFSSRGPEVELAAPGVEVYSTFAYPIFDDYIYRSLSGTSMAAPHVAGLAALIMEANPGISNVEARQKLANLAMDLGASGRDIEYGWGIPQADRSPDQPDAHAPVADTGGPYRGVVGEPIRFRAQGSVDLDDNLLTFGWDFGDGATGQGRSVNHVYRAPGNYLVTVTVWDRDGLQDAAESHVLVGAGVDQTGAFGASDSGYVREPSSVYLGRSVIAGIYSRKKYYGVAEFDVPRDNDMLLISAELVLTCTSRSPKDEGTITAGLLPADITQSWPAITYTDIAQAAVQPLESPITISYLHTRVYEGAEHRFRVPPGDLAGFEAQFKSGRVAFRMALDTGLSSNILSWTNPRLEIRYLEQVSKGDMAPVAEAGYDRRVVAGSQVILDGSASHDFEGSDLTYGWFQTTGPYVPLSVTSENPEVATFTAPAGDDALIFELEVDDGYHTSTDQVTIYLNNAPADIHETVLTPGFGKAGYVHEYLSDMNFFDKPLILSGIQDWLTLDDTDFLTFGVFQFDLSSIPPGSQIVKAALELTGAWKWVGKPAKFEVQLLEPSVDGVWEHLDYATVTEAQSLLTLQPTLGESNLGEEVVNRFNLGPGYLEERRDSTKRLTFRIDGPRLSYGHGWMWFTWWSGNRADTADRAPRLIVEYGAIEAAEIPPPDQNRPPVPEIVAPTTAGEPGIDYPFTFSAVDPDQDMLRLVIDWGDGEVVEIRDVASGESVTLSHIWENEGTFIVRLQAIDEAGASASVETLIRIQAVPPPEENQPPAIDTVFGPESGFVGGTYTFEVSATDSDGDPVRFTVDWGDGTVDTSEFYPPGTMVAMSHDWAEPGAYTMVFTATDDRGASASAEFAMAIAASEGEELVVSDTPTGTWYLGSSYGRRQQAQTFRTIGSEITAALLALTRIGEPDYPIRVSIQRSLTASPMATVEVNPSDIVSTDEDNPSWVTATFETPVEVNDGSYYYLVLETPRADGANYYRVGYDHTNPYPYGMWYLNGQVRRDLDMACSLTFAR